MSHPKEQQRRDELAAVTLRALESNAEWLKHVQPLTPEENARLQSVRWDLDAVAFFSEGRSKEPVR